MSQLQILLPIYNESESIRATVLEIHAVLKPIVDHEFLLCEDGSTDNTKEVLRELATEVPARLELGEERKGYSKAVRDGMLKSTAEWVLCLDSDGQCDPKDFAKFWQAREMADVLIGWRVNRADNVVRKAMSRSFYLAWQMLLGGPIHDPSCPFLLARQEVVHFLAKRSGRMRQGYWWEYMGRAFRQGLSVLEFPVNHRERAAGETQVYKWNKIPGIAWKHGIAMWQIWAETRNPEVIQFNFRELGTQLQSLDQQIRVGTMAAGNTESVATETVTRSR